MKKLILILLLIPSIAYGQDYYRNGRRIGNFYELDIKKEINLEDPTSGSNDVTIQATDDTQSYLWTLPKTRGNTSDLMQRTSTGGTTWDTLSNIADGIYLRLDTTNDPLTGDLDMGSNNITGMGNITGTDVDISAGTGDYLSTGEVSGATAAFTGKADFNTGQGAAGDIEWCSTTSCPAVMFDSSIGRTDYSADILVNTSFDLGFRSLAKQFITSGAIDELDIEAEEAIDFNRAGTNIMRLTNKILTFNNGATDTILNWALDGILISGVGGNSVTLLTATGLLGFPNNTIDLGSDAFEWKDLYIDGVAYLDQISAGAGDELTVDTSGNLTTTGDVRILSDSSLLEIGANAGGDVSLGFDGTDAVFSRVTGLPDIKVAMPLAVNVAGLREYSQFGPTPTNIVPSGNNDMLAVTFVDDTTGANRAMLVTSEYNGANTTSTAKPVGLNSFAHIDSNDNMTSQSSYGGAGGGRYVFRHYGNGIVTLASGLSSFALLNNADANGGSTTRWIGHQSEGSQVGGTGAGPTYTVTDYIDFGATARKNASGALQNNVNADGTVTNRYSFYIEDWATTAGTFTNQYGLFINDLTGATNNYGITSEITSGANKLFINHTGTAESDFFGNINIKNAEDLRWWDSGSSNYVGFEAPALTGNQVWVLPSADGSADDVLKTDGAGNLDFATPTIEVPINISMFDAVPSRGSVSDWNGGVIELDNAASVSSGVPFVMSTKGSGKILIVINAGSDMVGDITATGTSVDRNTKAQTASDTSVMTLTGVSTDSSTTDANGNFVPVFTKAYITDKWYTGVVTLSTTNTTITDMDIYHVSFEQFNDQSNIVLNTFDANIFTTNVNAEFDAYLHTLHVTGDEVDVDNEAELHVGAVGGATAQTAQANKYFRLRQGNIAEALDGATDGFWVAVYYANSPVYVEDVTLKIWATCTHPLILN